MTPLTKPQYARALFFGRLALWIVLVGPVRWAPGWLLTSAGFYAYDDGWEAYRWRCDEMAREPAHE